MNPWVLFGMAIVLVGLACAIIELIYGQRGASDQDWYVNQDQHVTQRRARVHDMRQRMRRRNGKPDVWGMDRQDPPQGRAS